MNESQFNKQFEKSSQKNVDKKQFPNIKRYPFCETYFRTNFNQDINPKLAEKTEDINYSRFIDVAEFEDNHNYKQDVPVKYTASQQLLDLKQQSSLFQILQPEVPNIRNLSLNCTNCKIPHCFGCSRSPSVASHKSLGLPIKTNLQLATTKLMAVDNKPLTRHAELEHERETKWESYLKYIQPKKCACTKMSKKHLSENLPPYFTKNSYYDAPELLNYETCSVMKLKALVKNAMGVEDILPSPPAVPSRTKEIAVQYSNLELEGSCNCPSNERVCQFINNLITEDEVEATNSNIRLQLVDSYTSRTYLNQDIYTFASRTAADFRRIIGTKPELKKLF